MVYVFKNKEDFLGSVLEALKSAKLLFPIIRELHPPIYMIAVILAHPLDQIKQDVLVRYDYQCVSAEEVNSLAQDIIDSVKLK